MARRPQLLASVAIAVGFALGLNGLVLAQQDEPQHPTPVGPKIIHVAPVRATPPVTMVTPGEPEAPAPAPPTAVASDDSADEGDAPSSKPAPKPVVPLTRPRYAVAVIQALDKVSAETLRFEAPINQPIRYKSLIFIVRACETTAPDEVITDAAAHVEIVSQPKGPDNVPPPPGKPVFKGWMFSNSPGLNLFQHPVYDAWLIACKTVTPSA